jgi:hypothetical protein
MSRMKRFLNTTEFSGALNNAMGVAKGAVGGLASGAKSVWDEHGDQIKDTAGSALQQGGRIAQATPGMQLKGTAAIAAGNLIKGESVTQGLVPGLGGKGGKRRKDDNQVSSSSFDDLDDLP